MSGKEYHRGTSSKKKHSKVIASDLRIIEDLQKSLGTKVSILRSKSGQGGKLVLDFYSSDDLSGLFERLVGNK